MHWAASFLVWSFDLFFVLLFILLLFRFLFLVLPFRYNRFARLVAFVTDRAVDRVRRATSFWILSFDTGRLAPLTALVICYAAFKWISPALYQCRLFLIR